MISGLMTSALCSEIYLWLTCEIELTFAVYNAPESAGNITHGALPTTLVVLSPRSANERNHYRRAAQRTKRPADSSGRQGRLFPLLQPCLILIDFAVNIFCVIALLSDI